MGEIQGAPFDYLIITPQTDYGGTVVINVLDDLGKELRIFSTPTTAGVSGA